MEHLIVDVSPMAINRTAMYFVVQASVRALIERGTSIELVGCGLPIPLAEFIANDYELTGPQSREVNRRIMDLVHGPTEPRGFRPKRAVFIAFDPLYLLTRPAGSRAVVMVLDLTPLTRPAWHNPAVSAAYAVAFERLLDSAVTISTISESTARDLWANLAIPPSRATAIPLYNRFTLAARPPDPNRRVLLFVGSLETRKNVAGLGLAFAASGLLERGYQLHIIGGDGHGSDEIRSALAALPGVVLRGRLSDDELNEAYDSCAALAYPSSWEGFGLPALEALARGIPLLCADTGALPEVCGPHAIYVDPCNPRALVNGLRALADAAERDDQVAVASRAQWAGQFTFDVYLDRFISVIRSAVEREVAPDVAVSRSTTLRRLVSVPDPSDRNRRRILDRRIVGAVLGPVPGDSFSLDYLYSLQSEARAQFTGAVAQLRSTSAIRLPRALARAISAGARLELRNLVIRSLINETVARRLHGRGLGE